MFGGKKKKKAPMRMHPDFICKNCEEWDSRKRCHVTWLTTKETDWCNDFKQKTGMKKPVKL